MFQRDRSINKTFNEIFTISSIEYWHGRVYILYFLCDCRGKKRYSKDNYVVFLLNDTNHKKKKKCLVNTYIKFDNDHQIVNQTTETLWIYQLDYNIATNKRIDLFQVQNIQLVFAIISDFFIRRLDQIYQIITTTKNKQKNTNHYCYFRTYNVILIFVMISDYLSSD